MALRDPNSPWGWAPPEWEQQFDPTAPLGTVLTIPDLVPPNPMPGDAVEPGSSPFAPIARPPASAGNPYPEAYDDAESRGAGGAPWTNTFNPLTNRHEDASGKTIFPYGDQPLPAPRTDAARIGLMGGPSQAEEVARSAQGQPLSPEEEERIEMHLSPEEEAQIELLTPPAPWLEAPKQAAAGLGDAAHAVTDTVAKADGRRPGPMPDEYLSDDELAAEMHKRSPEEQAMFLAKIERSRDNFAATRALEESERTRQAAEENLRNREQAMKTAQQRAADLDAQAQQIASKNPTESIPGYQKLFGVLASIVGGFGANRTGRNMGLEIVDSIANDAAQQQAQKLQVIARARAGVGEQMGAADDAYRAAEAVRLATYDVAIKALQSEMQLYDQRGTTVRDGMLALNDLQARRQQAAEQAWQRDFDNQVKAGELAIKTRKQGLEETKFLTEEQRRAAAAAGAGVRQSPEYWEAYSGGKRPPHAMTQKEFNAWIATAGKVKALNKGPNDKSEAQLRKEEADAAKAEAEAEAAKTGFVLKNPETGRPILNPDGTPVVEMDATKRNRASSITEAAANIRRLADRMAALKAKYGGSIKALGSDEAQELQQLVSQIDFETFKAFDLGAPSEGDRDLAEGVRGGVDPTSFVKNATAGFQAYADAVEKKANTALRNSGYTGPAIRFARAGDLKKPAPTVADEAAARLTGAAEYEGQPDPSRPWEMPNPLNVERNKRSDEDFIVLEAEAGLASDRGDVARKHLAELAERAVSPAVRTRAKAILDSLPGRNARTDEAR